MICKGAVLTLTFLKMTPKAMRICSKRNATSRARFPAPSGATEKCDESTPTHGWSARAARPQKKMARRRKVLQIIGSLMKQRRLGWLREYLDFYSRRN